MKKILLFLSTLGLLMLPTLANAGSWTAGVTLSDNTLDTAGAEDVDNNGTTDDTKNVTDDLKIGSIFAEYTNMGDRFGITVGIDIIPFDADIDKRSISQASIKGAGTGTSGTNSVSATVEGHRTIYIQPGIAVGTNSMFYLTAGLVSADINGKSSSISHTDIDETKSLDGKKYGVGIKRVADSGMVVKLDYAETSYDTVSFITDNDTRATADLDNQSIAISIGKQF